MLPLPPLSFNPSSGASGGPIGGSPWNQGDWTVNVAGSGTALQSASAMSPLLIALAVGATWLLLRK